MPSPPPIHPTLHHRSKSSHTAIDFWKYYSQRPLDAIFRPRSVALIGASEKEGSVGRTILWNLMSSPFGGTIYPVNNRRARRGSNIFGIRSYKNVQEIPERGIDLAIIAVPARAVKEVRVFDILLFASRVQLVPMHTFANILTMFQFCPDCIVVPSSSSNRS